MIELHDIQTYSTDLLRQVETNARFSVVEAACRRHFGHILFTALRFDYDQGVMTRLYSNREDVSPVEGTKPMPTGMWADRLIAGRQCYIGYSKQDLKEVFFDHETLWAAGCESVMNVPVVWGDRTVGSFNVLGEANHYDQQKAAAMGVLGQLAAPCFLLPT